VRTGEYDSTDYCVTDSRSDLLDANSQLDCGTGDALLVGSVANDGLTLQLQPHQGGARNAIRFNAPTVTGSRRQNCRGPSRPAGQPGIAGCDAG
jgi:hypothetical protein